MKLCTFALTLALLLCGAQAQAAQRVGGGKSLGKQSANVTQREAAPAAPGIANAATKPGAPQALPQPAAQPKRAWGGMLGGLAAGLGLAWLAQSLGFGEAFAHAMAAALMLVLLLAVVAWLARRRLGAQGAGAGPFAFQGMPASRASAVRSYSPENVGNDASARPFERKGLSFDSMTNPGSPMVKIGSAQSGMQGWGIPAGFDTDGFLHAAKANFVSLQAAWDRSDLSGLRAMMTDGMLVEIQAQLNEREQHTGGPANFTEVVMIQARLLGIEDLGQDYMASVEFSGMIREDISAGPAPFREVWNMTKPKDGAIGWLVAGVQALQ